MKKTRTLFRPVGPNELALIKKSGWTAFPPRLPEQPIFYPVMNEEYAAQIAQRWNVRSSGSGFVTQFEVDLSYINQYDIENVGAAIHNELWIPAEELHTFNQHIVGKIDVIQSFYAEKEVRQIAKV